MSLIFCFVSGKKMRQPVRREIFESFRNNTEETMLLLLFVYILLNKIVLFSYLYRAILVNYAVFLFTIPTSNTTEKRKRKKKDIF